MAARPRLLDLYCCAGGAGMGYHLAGFDVTGVDSRPQPHYPFAFVQADALGVLADPSFLAAFDAIHASPPCQHKARVTAWRGNREDHPDLLTPTLAALESVTVPWVVENVPEACPPLRADFMLCTPDQSQPASSQSHAHAATAHGTVPMHSPPVSFVLASGSLRGARGELARLGGVVRGQAVPSWSRRVKPDDPGRNGTKGRDRQALSRTREVSGV